MKTFGPESFKIFQYLCAKLKIVNSSMVFRFPNFASRDKRKSNALIPKINAKKDHNLFMTTASQPQNFSLGWHFISNRRQ